MLLVSMAATPKTKEELKARLAQLHAELKALSPKEVPMEAALLHQMGEVAYKMADYPSAEKALQRAVELDKQVYGGDHPEIARGLNDLAMVLRAMGRSREAAEFMTESLRLYQKINGPGHPTVARGYHNLGRARLSNGESQTAREHLEKSLWIKQQALGKDHASVRPTAQVLGLATWQMKDFPAAREAFATAWTVSRKHKGEEHPDTVLDRHLLGRMEERCGRMDDAMTHFEGVVKAYNHIEGHAHAASLALNSLGRLQGRLGRGDAVETLKMAVAMGDSGAGGITPLHNLGVALFKKGKHKEALPHLEKSLALAKKHLGDGHARTRMYERNLQRARHLMEKAQSA